MKSVLVKLFLLRKYIYIYLFCCFYPAIVAAERGGFLYFKFLCYQNPGNKLLSGYICDGSNTKICLSSFTICISKQYINDEIHPENCHVYYKKTRTYENEELICPNPNDHTKYMKREEIKQKISISLQDRYFVKIEVQDVPRRNDILIASFGAEFNQIPSAVTSQIVYKNMRMNRTESVYHNPAVSLDISMALQCDGNGPHCYSNYNPCSNNPCQNEGICSPKKIGEIGYECQCKHPFYGPQCTNEIDICESKPCKNNASCHHIKPDAFHCKCLQGFNGTLCEIEIFNDTANPRLDPRLKLYLLCSIIFVILVVIFLVFIACFILKRRAKRNKKYQHIDEIPMFKKDLERKPNLLPDISNQMSDASGTRTPSVEIYERNIYDSS